MYMKKERKPYKEKSNYSEDYTNIMKQKYIKLQLKQTKKEYKIMLITKTSTKLKVIPINQHLNITIYKET